MNKQGKTWIGALVVLIIIVSAVVWRQTTSETEVTIGAILPLTGGAASWGGEIRRGIELAESEIDSNKVKVVYEDSKLTPADGVNAYNKLKSADKASGFIVAGTNIAAPLLPLINQDNKIMMGAAVWGSSYSKPNDNAFRVDMTVVESGKKLVDYIVRSKFKTVGITYINNPFGVDFANAFRKEAVARGLQIVADEGYAGDTTDYRTLLTKIKAQNPQVIFNGDSLPGHTANIIKQAGELGIKTNYVSLSTVQDKILIDTAQAAANGLVYVYPLDEQSAAAKKLIDAYNKKFGELPKNTYYVAVGYQTLKTLVQGYAACGYEEDNNCVKNKLTVMKDFDTIFGKLSFDENGDVHFLPALKTVKDGKFVMLVQ